MIHLGQLPASHCFLLFSSGLAYWMWKRCCDQLECACKQNQRIEHVLQLTLCYWKPGTCRSMTLFYFFFNDGREKRMNYKMIKKHFSTAVPWYTMLCNINAIINHTFCLFHVLGSMFSTLCGTGFFYFVSMKACEYAPASLSDCSAQLSKPCKCALTKLSAASLYWCHSSRDFHLFHFIPFLVSFSHSLFIKSGWKQK